MSTHHCCHLLPCQVLERLHIQLHHHMLSTVHRCKCNQRTKPCSQFARNHSQAQKSSNQFSRSLSLSSTIMSMRDLNTPARLTLCFALLTEMPTLEAEKDDEELTTEGPLARRYVRSKLVRTAGNQQSFTRCSKRL